jgi:hypothetical protein
MIQILMACFVCALAGVVWLIVLYKLGSPATKWGNAQELIACGLIAYSVVCAAVIGVIKIFIWMIS